MDACAVPDHIAIAQNAPSAAMDIIFLIAPIPSSRLRSPSPQIKTSSPSLAE
jgi:hypothetical protein